MESILSSPSGRGSPRGRIGILPIISSALNPARSSSPSFRLGGCPKELATDAEKVRADLTEVTEKVAREC